ncbi:histidine phosphatase family protein [Leucobacter sp. gxy201]|uniref:SixA phosphatase family protein n=1 Tax=Leucobacter sp. gxy201 TaxID=2957200 RepID=UPI003DA16790
MVELILARHAKSDWGDPGITDHDRPLNPRGLRDAPAMAERLVRSGAQVERILSSTALRARTTAAQFGEALGIEVEQRGSLYLASDDELFEQAAAAGDSSVMIVAHDPGLTELAFRLSGGGIPHMPTCAVARFTWDVDSWSDVGDRSPDRWSFDSPRGGSVNT